MSLRSGQVERSCACSEGEVQHNILRKMFLACIACCLFGMIEMYLFHYVILAAIFLVTFVAALLCAFLSKQAIIPAQIAALIPMLILCFVYTPVSWYTFDGLMGNTPYLSIIFVTVIIITNYKRGTQLLIGLYLASLAGMTADWFLSYQGTPPPISVISTAIAWTATLTSIIILLGNASKQTREYNRAIFDRSIRDALTGLYNRNAIEQIFYFFETRYDSINEDYVVMMLDIDQFKRANDQHGHVVGDEMLIIVASTIQASIRETDYAVRYGGDEFLVILPAMPDEGTKQIITRIGDSLRNIHEWKFPITLSAGCAHRSECVDKKALIALADARMYAQKRNRSNTPCMSASKATGDYNRQSVSNETQEGTIHP